MNFPVIKGQRVLELGLPGSHRARLNALVMAQQKTATAGLWDEYLEEGELVEEVGEHLYLVNDLGEPIGEIEVTRVDIRKFKDVDLEFALAEGESFEDIEHWRKEHRAFWSANAEPEMQSAGHEGWRITNESLVVCVWFRLVKRNS
jgi:uncharacterized protein YhfF